MRNDTLQALDRKFKRIHTIDSISGLLGWDELVNLPPESADQGVNNQLLSLNYATPRPLIPKSGNSCLSLNRNSSRWTARLKSWFAKRERTTSAKHSIRVLKARAKWMEIQAR